MDKLDILDREKYPISKENHVGIEIEFVSPYDSDDLSEMLIGLDLHFNCHLGDDGSIDEYLPSKKVERPKFVHTCQSVDFDDWHHFCNGCDEEDNWEINNDPYDNDCTGHELRILTTESELRDTLNRVAIFLKKAKAEVNETCGLHVHLDMRTRKIDTCVNRFLAKQKQMHTMVDKKRLTSQYCKPLTKSEVKAKNYDKYRDINVRAYRNLGTLEIRLHEGCVNTTEIYNWTRYLIAIADNKKVSKMYVKKRTMACA